MIAIFLFAYPIAAFTSRYMKSKKLPFGATWVGNITSIMCVGICSRVVVNILKIDFYLLIIIILFMTSSAENQNISVT